MKKLKRWLKDIFDPENNLDVDAMRSAFNDVSVRTLWLSTCLDELARMNQEVDKRLLNGLTMQLTDLCARRKAYQDVLEAILSARRQVVAGSQDVRPNPKSKVDVDLDRVTA